jgi:hypothetical protein
VDEDKIGVVFGLDGGGVWRLPITAELLSASFLGFQEAFFVSLLKN